MAPQGEGSIRRSDGGFRRSVPALLFVVVIFFIWYLIHNANGPPGSRGGRSVFVPYGGSWGSGDRAGAAVADFRGGGGFSGGGGSSGGGGASGSW